MIFAEITHQSLKMCRVCQPSGTCWDRTAGTSSGGHDGMIEPCGMDTILLRDVSLVRFEDLLRSNRGEHYPSSAWLLSLLLNQVVFTDHTAFESWPERPR